MTDEVLLPPYTSRARHWISRSLEPIRRIGRAKAPSDAESMSNVRRAAVAMLIAFALFALFESEGIRHFTRDLPGNAVTDVLVRGADQWHALMEELGPAQVQPAVQDAFDRIRHIRWWPVGGSPLPQS